MIQKLMCRFLGHKTVYKGYIGQTTEISTAFGDKHIVPIYHWERSKFCLRCGNMVFPVPEEAK